MRTPDCSAIVEVRARARRFAVSVMLPIQMLAITIFMLVMGPIWSARAQAPIDATCAQVAQTPISRTLVAQGGANNFVLNLTLAPGEKATFTTSNIVGAPNWNLSINGQYSPPLSSPRHSARETTISSRSSRRASTSRTRPPLPKSFSSIPRLTPASRHTRNSISS